MIDIQSGWESFKKIVFIMHYCHVNVELMWFNLVQIEQKCDMTYSDHNCQAHILEFNLRHSERNIY